MTELKGSSGQQKTNNDCDLSVHISSPVIEEEHTISQYSLDNTEPMEDTEPYDNIPIASSDKPKLQRVDAVLLSNLRSADNEATFAIVFDMLSAHSVPDVTGTTVCTESCDIVNGIIDSVLEAITTGKSCMVDIEENTKPTNKCFDMVAISNTADEAEQKFPMNKMKNVMAEGSEAICERRDVICDSVIDERSKVTISAEIIQTKDDISTEEVVKSPEVEMYDDVNEILDSNKSTAMFEDIFDGVKNVLTNMVKKIDETSLITMTNKIEKSSQQSSHTLGSLESDDKMADSEKVQVNEDISVKVEHVENISTHDRTKYSSAAIDFFKMADMSLAHQPLGIPHDQFEDKIEQQIQEDMSEPNQEEEDIREGNEECHQLNAVQTASKFLEDITDEVANTVQHNRDELLPKPAKAVVQSIQLELTQVKIVSQPDCYQNEIQVQEPSLGENDSDKVVLFLENVINRVGDVMYEKTMNNQRKVKLNEDDKIESVANVEYEVENMIITEKDQEENNTTANIANVKIIFEKVEHENITANNENETGNKIASAKDQDKALASANNEKEIDKSIKVSEKNQEENISIPNNKDKVENLVASEKDQGEAITAVNNEKEFEGTTATTEYQVNINEVLDLMAPKRHQGEAITTPNEVKNIISTEKENKASENEENKVKELIASARNYMETTVAQYENNIHISDINTTNQQMDGPYTGDYEPNSISQGADSEIANHKGVKRKLDFPRNCAVCPMFIELPKDDNIKEMSQEKASPIIDSVSISQTIRAMLITLISEDVPYHMDPIETCLEKLTADHPDYAQKSNECSDEQDNIESGHKKFVLCRDDENDHSTIYQTEQELNPTDSNSDFANRFNAEPNTGSPYHINDEEISYSPIIGSLSSSSSSDVLDPGTDMNVPCDDADDEGVELTTVQFQTASHVLSERLSQGSIDENPSASDINNKHSEQSKGSEFIHEMNLKRKTTYDDTEDEVIPPKVRAIEDDYSTTPELTELGPKDQQVPGFVNIAQSQDDTTVEQHTLLQDDISFNHEESFYGELNGGKVYACDADLMDDKGGSQCQTVDEHDSQGSIEEAGAPESLNNVTPLKTCPRSIRLGLSKNSRPGPLHKNFQIPFKR
ncbi:unnamed protein product [Owenia fusiformis]|uniref:RAD51 interacting motif domain-containing protein n=1 Tax=Owenia fusiformis TaxID=6347 RepID=A0A8S4MZ13_OWEFU|nr:unnamed protein product [Owenia fusiformis]